MSNPQTIFSPYGELPEADIHTTTIAINRRDWAFIQGVHGGKGATQAVIYNLLTRFVAQLKNHNITEYDPDSLKRAIESAIVTIAVPIRHALNPGATDNVGNPVQRSSEPDCRPEAVDRNDGRGTIRVEQQGERRHDELPVAGGVGKGKTDKRKVRQKRTPSGPE